MSRQLYKSAIWKYELQVTDKQIVKMPRGARLLTVQTQGDTVCLWAEVAPERDILPRQIRIWGTGHPIEPSELEACRYVGTVQLQGGALVFHVYDGGER